MKHGPGAGRGPGGGMHVAQKAKNFKGTSKRLLGYLKPHWAKLLTVFFAAILSTAFMIIGPNILKNATNLLVEGVMPHMAAVLNGVPAELAPPINIDFNGIAGVLLTLVGIYFVSSVFSWIQQFVMAGVSQKVVYDMRKQVDDKLSKLPLKYFDGRTHGEILSRITNDVDTVAQTLQQSLTQLITSVVTIVGVLIMMLTISPLLTLVTFITIPLCLVITIFVVKRSQKYFVGQQRVLGELNGHVEEMYTGHKEVKAYGHEQKAVDEFNTVNEELYEYNRKAQFISGIIMPLMTFVNNLGYVFVAVIGGLRVANGQLTVGDVQAFIQYSNQFTQPINQTANIANILQSTVAAAERVFEVLDEEEQIPEALNPKRIEAKALRGAVQFDHVDFRYNPAEPLIEDMNVQVSPGQTVAIVGPTGAGKTTLVNLLMRFYEIDGGAIRVDGMDIRDMTREGLRSIFGMVLQDTWLFNGTIRENIAYSRPDATLEQVMAAAKAARVDHYIRTLPDGYDTVLNEEASNISQGQKQLLTIARVILADPAILILDEATSNVDTRTEIQIQKAMNALMQGRTSFVIAHRLSTIRDADIILVMNNGRIIETGNHRQLLEQGGFYADLYNSQFAAKPSA